ncbi:glycosylated lysosomal membrane protein [Salminus brasiliensis]|uniref:glycosylated lysosomal membrane protein n=1 Tax=Salminus brasiliensis TaxID=930266 RepID=UPI003B82CE95
MAAVGALRLVPLLLSVVARAGGFGWSGDAFQREVSLELNPGQQLPAPGVDLLHVRALGENDTLHFLLCSKGAPAVLLVHTNSRESTVQVDWPAFLSHNSTGSLRVVPESSVQYSSALVFSRLLEYDDVNNTADPQDQPDSSFLPPYDLQNFTWSDLNSSLDYTRHTALLCGRDGSSGFSNGSFCLQFSAFESEGREKAWPSLLHSANSSQLRMWLEGVKPRTNQSRFTLELQSVSEEGFQARVDVHKFIDDEFTPSIFQVSQWVSSKVNSSALAGFAQWKPVAYRQRVPVLEDATPCRNTPPISLAHPTPSGLVSAYFTHSPLTYGINVSFGMAEDPFYSSTHFISWTLLVGMGTPPSDFFSPLVMGIMAVGLGTPLALIMLGGIYVCIRKTREEPLGYQPIN